MTDDADAPAIDGGMAAEEIDGGDDIDGVVVSCRATVAARLSDAAVRSDVTTRRCPPPEHRCPVGWPMVSLSET
jgi:hypothetical protein